MFSATLEGDLYADLVRLEKNVRQKVIASGAAAAARVVADEVRLNTMGIRPNTPGIVTGNLHNSIYWAKNDALTKGDTFAYSISWNKSKAPHGHLLEFGHWRVNVVFRDERGQLVATKQRLAQPVWVPAQPFIRPAASKLGEAVRIGMQRMRVKFAEINR